ncbi:Serine/threonine-protein kinase Aurora-1 [Platanthera zijinensis]|uniref:Serine/threonine-protein kinase Aurora-1 n=1 Tax=Platanthera zijinensis TaxID=2320716 RepID=A0AAP0G9V6_9ASPA
MADEEWILADFEIGKVIGEGKFGKVYLAREKQAQNRRLVVTPSLLGRSSLQNANPAGRFDHNSSKIQSSRKQNGTLLKIRTHSPSCLYSGARLPHLQACQPPGLLLHAGLHDPLNDVVRKPLVYKTKPYHPSPLPPWLLGTERKEVKRRTK